MIRDFHPSDMQAVLSIWLEASVEAHQFVGREFWESRLDDMRDVYLPASETYVCVEDEAVKGFVSLHGDTLAAIFVSPDMQGKGIGTQLMNKAKQIRQSLNLTVYKENQRSVEFYRKCGFEVEKEQTCQHTGHPELVMVFIQ